MNLDQFHDMTRDEMEAVRLAAAKDLASGMRQADVARKYGRTRTTVSRWARTLNTEGEEAMRKTKCTGRPSKLTPEQLAEVDKMRALTGPQITALIEQKFGVRYSEGHIYKLGKPSKPRRKLVRAVGERHDR